jgi:hypothetical protein
MRRSLVFCCCHPERSEGSGSLLAAALVIVSAGTQIPRFARGDNRFCGMGYTRRKIRGINRSFLLAGLVFAGWALACAWLGWPRGIRHGSAVAFGLFDFAALFFVAFPAIWARYPAKHPVNHELARWGDLSQVSARLDREMTGPVETVGPFRFTASMLVYDSAHEFQMIPYDQIVCAGKASDDVPAIKVKTRSGKSYQWYRSWMQGTFDPEEVVRKIRAAARLDDCLAEREDGATVHPSSATESPSAQD